MKPRLALLTLLTFTSLAFATKEKIAPPTAISYTFDADKPWGKTTATLSLAEKDGKQIITAITITLESGKKLEVPADKIAYFDQLPDGASITTDPGRDESPWLSLRFTYVTHMQNNNFTLPLQPQPQILKWNSYVTYIFHGDKFDKRDGTLFGTVTDTQPATTKPEK